MTTQKANRKGFNPVLFFLYNKALLLMIVIALMAIIATGGKFAKVSNIENVTRQVAVLAIVSVGYTVIAAGGLLDLSVGEAISLAVVTYGSLNSRVPIWLSMLITILVGALTGLFNGTMIRKFKLPPFVLTLGTGQIFKGIAHIITGGTSILQRDPTVKFIGQGKLFGFLPFPFMETTVIMILVAILLNRTLFGRHLLAAGGNAEAANVSGIRVDKVKIVAHMIAGAIYGVAAIVLTGRVSNSIPTAGDGYMMDAISAVVIGGTPMHGGRAKVVGTLFGVLMIGIMNNMLNLLGVDTFYQWILKGVILITAILLDVLTEKVMAKQRVTIQSLK